MSMSRHALKPFAFMLTLPFGMILGFAPSSAIDAQFSLERKAESAAMSLT